MWYIMKIYNMKHSSSSSLRLSIFQRTPQGTSCCSNWSDTYRSANRNVNTGRTDRSDTLQTPHKTRGLWPSLDFWCYHHSPWGNSVLQGQVRAFISSNTFLWRSQRQSIKVSSEFIFPWLQRKIFLSESIEATLQNFTSPVGLVSNMVYWQVSKTF